MNSNSCCRWIATVAVDGNWKATVATVGTSIYLRQCNHHLLAVMQPPYDMIAATIICLQQHNRHLLRQALLHLQQAFAPSIQYN